MIAVPSRKQPHERTTEKMTLYTPYTAHQTNNSKRQAVVLEIRVFKSDHVTGCSINYLYAPFTVYATKANH